MASSGWQGERWCSGSSSGYLNLNITGITRNPTTVRVTGYYRVQIASNYNIYYNGVYLSYSGGNDTFNMNGWGVSHDTYFDKTFDAAAPVTSLTLSASVSASTVLYGSGSWTISFASGATAPNISLVSLTNVGINSANISAKVSTYGTPVADDSYMEVAILGTSTYGTPYRYVHSANKATKMTSQVVTNSSLTGSSPLTICPNTKYWYGAWATNRTLNASKVGGSFITKPNYPTSLSSRNDGGNVTITWSVPSGEGKASTVKTYGSLDGKATWTEISSPWTFYQPEGGVHTAYVKRVGDGGESSSSVSYISEVSNFYYGKDNKAVLCKKVYIGDSENKAREMKKIYIGDENNKARKVLG